MPRKTVTIGSLAAHLGIAKGTVSRALNDYPDISASTKKRVARAAMEFGYIPSTTAQNLSLGVEAPKLHLVRLTADPAALRGFYVDGLGLKVLSEGTDHLGCEHFIVGALHCPYQLEFRKSSRLSNDWMQHKVVSLVFDLSDLREWQATVIRMKTAKFAQVDARRPSLANSCQTFEDPDGFHVTVRYTSGQEGAERW